MAYANNVNAGTAKATVTLKGNYSGSAEKEFAIGKADASEATVTVATVAYGADAVAVVELEGFTLTANDYDVVGLDYDAVGSSIPVTVTFKGNFTGSSATTYDVTPAQITSADISVNGSVIYNGEAQTPALTVESGETTFVLGTDYNVSYTNNVNAGTANVVLSFTGNYEGTVEGTFTIAPKQLDGGIQAIDSVVYNGAAHEPTLTVNDGNNTLSVGSDYTVSYANNVNAGTATATVEFIGNYDGTASATFTIEKFDLASATVTVPDGLKFTGFAVEPVPTVTAHGATIDLTAAGLITTYKNNIELSASGTTADTYADDYGVGTVTVTAPADGNYSGKIDKDFNFYNPTVDKRLDSDDSDWANYKGNEAVIYTLALKDQPQYTVVVRIWWGSDGVYIFTEATHAVLVDNTAIGIELVVARKDEAIITGTQYNVNVDNYYFRKGSVSIASTVRSFTSSLNEGVYTTKIEAFIPTETIKGKVSTYFEGDVLGADYDLRAGVHWEGVDDTQRIFYGTRTVAADGKTTDSAPSAATTGTVQWQAANRNGNRPSSSKLKAGSKDAIDNFWYIDSNNAAINRGLRSSKHVAKEMAIDGNLSDWAAFDAAVGEGTIKGKYTSEAYTNGEKDGRVLIDRAFYGSDGMYVAVDATTDKFIYGNVATSNANKTTCSLFPNTSMEIAFFRDEKVGTEKLFNGNVDGQWLRQIGVTYGVNTSTYDPTVAGEKGLIESCWKTTKLSNGKYNHKIEIFIPNAALEYQFNIYKAMCANATIAEKIATANYTVSTTYNITQWLFGNNVASQDWTTNTSATNYGYAGDAFYDSATDTTPSGFFVSKGKGAKGSKFVDWTTLTA